MPASPYRVPAPMPAAPRWPLRRVLDVGFVVVSMLPAAALCRVLMHRAEWKRSPVTIADPAPETPQEAASGGAPSGGAVEGVVVPGLLPGLGAGPLRSPLSQWQIEDGVRAHQQEATRCVPAGPRGSVLSETIEVTIDAGGMVTEAIADPPSTALGDCLQKQILTWTFPRSAGTRVRIPFVFTAQ